MVKDEYANYIKNAFAWTTYGQWLKSEGVAVYEDWYVSDVWELDRTPWPRLGGNGCVITIYPMMEAGRGLFIGEIPPGRALEPIRHLYEQMIWVLEGHGTTEVWQEGDTHKHVFEWGRGSIFSPPLNTWYRMYNLGQEPVLFMATNRAPAIMNTFENPDFIFNCPYTFRDRFDGAEGYFSVAPRQNVNRWGEWRTNFIPNILETDLDSGEYKASGGGSVAFRMAGNQTTCHISQWPVGRYHKAHYHGAGAVLFGLRSEGYVLIWSKDLGFQPYASGNGDGVIEIPWGRGSVYSPPSEWFHQHFNTGKEPARHLAIRGGNPFSGAIMGRDVGESNPNLTGTDEGGTLLHYENEDPEIRRHYAEVLKAKGIAVEMPPEIYEPGYTRAHPGPRRG